MLNIHAIEKKKQSDTWHTGESEMQVEPTEYLNQEMPTTPTIIPATTAPSPSRANSVGV